MKIKSLSLLYKNIILFIIVFLSVGIKNTTAQGTCASATNIASLPYTKPGVTNCGLGATYSGTPACLNATYFIGEDYVFTYTPAATECVKIQAIFVAPKNAPWNSGMAILDNCPTTAGAACVASINGNLTASGLTITSATLTAGTTYYIVISGGQSLFASPPNECMSFDFSMSNCPIPPPPPPPLPTTPQGVECGTNLGFENGDLSLWTGYTGVNTQTPTTVGLVPGVNSVNGTQGTCGATSGWTGARQTRTTGAGTDPNTDNVVTVVAPGCRTSSVRIGNDECGYQSEAMEQTFLVTTANVLFTYLYAVVLQDPGHAAADEPKFEITMKDQGANVITCGGIYSITSNNATADGFVNATAPACGGSFVYYKNWTAVGTDLTPYIGANITIRFTTSDCTQGGHFGYAYVDTYCKPKEIMGTKVCTLGASITLTAPAGFSNYTWAPGGATGQIITVNNPHDGDIYTVSFKSIVGTNCTSTVTDTIKLITATAIGDTTICSGAVGAKIFTVTSTDASATYSWASSPAGFTSTSPTPSVPLPAATTVYTVTVSSPLGCTLSKSVTITVAPCVMSATATSVTICNGTCGSIQGTGVSGTPPYTYSWSGGLGTGTGPYSVCPTTTTTYTLTVHDNGGLSATALSTVTVNPIPVATASANTPCAGSALNLTSTGGTTWSWTGPGGFTSTSQNPTIASSTVAMNGVYTVTVSSLGCTGSASVNVTVNPNPVISVPPATICSGNTAALTASGATNYTWTPAATLSASTGSSVTASPTVTTTYTVVGTDANGCSGSTTVVVTVNPPCGVGISATGGVVCNGGCAAVIATATSGIPPYSFLWSNGATTSAQTLCPAVTTTYTVTVSDNSIPITTASATAVITVNPNPVVSVNPAAICFGTSTSLTATGADSYSWVPVTGLTPATGSVVTANPTVTTTYTVTGTFAATGCTGITTVTVTVNPNPVITVPPATICVGTSAPLTATGANTYTWAPAATLSAGTGTSVTATPATTTTYTVTGTTTATGCTGSTTVTVTVNPNPVIAVPAASICSGASATLTASGADTYTWAPITGLTPATGSPVTANPTVTTTYTVTGTITATGCTGTTTVTVTVDPPITLTIAGFPPKCFNGTDGQAVVIAAGGDGVYTYSWTPVTGTAPSVNGPAGTYSVTVTDLFGCTAITSTVIINPTPITGTTSVTTANCNKSDGSATATNVAGGTPGYTYSWNTIPVQNTQTASNIPTGNYVVTVTDANGCTTTIAAFVPNAGGVTPSATNTNVTCFGGSDGSGTATQTGGTAPYTYLWNNGQNTNMANNLTAGTYIVVVTDVNGCSANTTVTVTQPTQVIVTSTSASMCPLTSATINATGTGGTGAISFAWNPGVLTGGAVTVSPVNTTVYTLTGTDANGCTATTTATVTVYPNPVISVPAATICFGDNTSLSASGANTYSWSPTTGLTPTTGANVTANPTTTTTYTVTGTDANGCTGVTTVTVTVNPLPVITVPPAGICPGDTATLTASGAITYTWSPGSGLSSNTGTTVIASPSTTTTYVVTGTNTFGCTAATITTVTVHPKPVASINASPNPASMFNPTIYFTDGSIGAVTWNWSLGDINHSLSTTKNPTFTYPDQIGTYRINLVVTNQFGCIDSTWIDVSIKGEYTFFIPNTFTPNGNGINDGFMPKGVGIDITDYDLWIFDRWGNLIWHTDTWGEAWDGRANGGADVAQIDTYVWKVHVRELDSHAVHNYIGHVNIVK